ncbi:MAG: hypothetical protein FWD31_10290, partial [Planctomycetaceae bacterium]|nr:hypothetical protein [Planctomycetaceae bacterium]
MHQTGDIPFGSNPTLSHFTIQPPLHIMDIEQVIALFTALMNGRGRALFGDEFDKIINGIRGVSSNSEKVKRLFLDLIPLLARYYFNRSGGNWSLPDFSIVPELREKFTEDAITLPDGIEGGALNRIK